MTKPKSAKPKAATIRDRIIGLERIRASDLRPSPKNWRRHGDEQRAAMRGVLAEIGYADVLVVRKTEDGTEIIDGHLRAETTPDMEVPCVVVDLDDAEAAKLLAVHDPLAAMAEADRQSLGELLRSVETQDEAVRAMLDGLAGENGIDLEAVVSDAEPDLPNGSDASKVKPIIVTPDQREIFEQAAAKLRRQAEDANMTEGRVAEFLSAEFIASP